MNLIYRIKIQYLFCINKESINGENEQNVDEHQVILEKASLYYCLSNFRVINRLPNRPPDWIGTVSNHHHFCR